MLVIFDCDGVLVDSERLAAEVFSQQLAKEGIELSPEQCFTTFKGHTLSYCVDWLATRYQGRLSEAFLGGLERATNEEFSLRLRATEGVTSVLDYLQNNTIPFCVASNGGHQKVQNSLRITGLDKYFEGRRFSAEDVFEGKPAPELYFYAAECMGIPPAFCVVIEDSLTGVTAALAAGMSVVTFGAEVRGVDVLEGRYGKKIPRVPTTIDLLNFLQGKR